MLEIKNVSTAYGHVEALREVSMTAAEGEIVSLIGANGAGKTTLLNTISGMTPAHGGQIMLRGVDITRFSPEKIVNLGVSQVPERRQVFTSLSVRDNLTLGSVHTTARARRPADQGSQDPATGDGDDLHHVPHPQAAGQAVGGHAFGRRATDAGDWSQPDGPAQGAAAG